MIDIPYTILKMYPNVVNIVDTTAYDANGNEVSYDLAAVNAYIEANKYKQQRAAEYPSLLNYIDGVVKGDQAQIDAYIAACQAVKTKYPKPE
jgi:hypothetical protein